MKSMYIGSGDVVALMSGKTTETHRKLLRRFVSDEIPYYCSKNSPIDALRTGSILEDRFYLTLNDEYLPQYKVESEDLNVCKATLDFAKLYEGKVVDFKELKTAFATDYLDINMYRDCEEKDYLPFVKKKYKHNWEQIQYQMFCAKLDSARLCYLEVQTYDDLENYSRVITEDEIVEFKITLDESFIEKLKARIKPFQELKNFYVNY